MGFTFFNSNPNSLRHVWNSISLENGWTGTLSYKNFLGIIFLQGSITPGTVTDGTQIASISSSISPTTIFTIPIAATEAGTTLTTLDTARVTINNSGSLIIYGFGSLASDSISINTTWAL